MQIWNRFFLCDINITFIHQKLKIKILDFFFFLILSNNIKIGVNLRSLWSSILLISLHACSDVVKTNTWLSIFYSFYCVLWSLSIISSPDAKTWGLLHLWYTWSNELIFFVRCRKFILYFLGMLTVTTLLPCDQNYQ